jgi:glycosyltransferase family protein
MPTVLVFSKDRPMQLHAYLESLFLFSDIRAEDINILYKETPEIDYTRVLSEFPGVNWVKEECFHDDLLRLIGSSGDYIMFGCDDVVFTSPLNLSFAVDILKENEDIFGFSFRLGSNIQPSPKSALNLMQYLKWNWQTATELHYNYPWELDCTLYRKSDVENMLSLYDGKIKSPNYFESEFATSPKKYIFRNYLACSRESSKAVVITVNAVQDTHNNGFDNRKLTDIFTLSNLYNVQKNKLNVQAISKRPNSQIHVGSDYFLLEKYDQSWQGIRVKPLPNKKQNKLKTFIKNIAYLFKYDLKKLAQESITKNDLNLALDAYGYEYSDDNKDLIKPRIFSPEKTISQLLETRASFCRFGDGEFSLMVGESIPFQKADARLTRRLHEVFRSNIDEIFIGIPYCYYSSARNMRELPKNFVRTWVAKNRDKITSQTSSNKQYYDTGCTQLYALFENYDFDNYFQGILDLWRDKDIAIICGETVFNSIETNIFSCAKTIEYQYAPSRDAFDFYDQILEKAKTLDNQKLIIIILGPTATVLAYDMARLGYRALDLGHVAKDYDYFTNKVEHDDATIANFFKPD